MSEVKRTTSIARRFARREFWKECSDALGTDIFLLIMVTIGTCFYIEWTTLGNNMTAYLERGLTITDPTDFWSGVSSLQYRFGSDTVPYHVVSLGEVATVVTLCFFVLLTIQVISLIATACSATRKARKILQPLEQMAATTEYLTQTPLDMSKFQDLEEAIDRITPNGPNATLATGDRDLAGLEQAVNNLLTRMRDAYRQQARFVSDASHELRTPIAVIQGYANMLDRWGKEDETILAESIAAIKSESDQMKMLVEQLLFLARGDSGRTKLELTHFSLGDMMAEVYEESGMIHPEHEWKFPPAEPIFAYGDIGLIKQTARILIDNAAKYSKQGEEITLRIGQNQKGEPFFSVQDNGIGIPSTDVPHVFERFFRADQSRARETGGTGLGLSIAKWIVDRHGGHFEVLSREDLGTRITVCLGIPPTKED